MRTATRSSLSAEDAPARAVAHSRLALEQVTVRFGGLVAVDDVSLSVMPGEVVSLIGPNGAGKTTLLGTVSGTVRAKGLVSLDGRPISSLTPVLRSRSGILRTFQRMALFEELTALENLVVSRELQRPVRLARGFLQRPRMDTRDRDDAEEVLALLGIYPDAHRRVELLSTGVRRLVELGRILMGSPRLILLDEPSSGLDRSETGRFKETIRSLCLTLPDVSILLVEHDMSVAFDLASHVYVLDFGKLIAEGTPDEIRDDEQVRAVYLGTEG